MAFIVQKHIYETAELFNIDRSLLKTIMPFKAEELSPDCSVCAFRVNDDSYYVIYIEDFVFNLNQVTDAINKWWGGSILEIIKPIKQVAESDIMSHDPHDLAELKKYMANPTHSDYTFLMRVSPPIDDSYFGITHRQLIEQKTTEQKSSI